MVKSILIPYLLLCFYLKKNFSDHPLIEPCDPFQTVSHTSDLIQRVANPVRNRRLLLSFACCPSGVRVPPQVVVRPAPRRQRRGHPRRTGTACPTPSAKITHPADIPRNVVNRRAPFSPNDISRYVVVPQAIPHPAPRRCGHHPRLRPRRISPAVRGKHASSWLSKTVRFCHSAFDTSDTNFRILLKSKKRAICQ